VASSESESSRASITVGLREPEGEGDRPGLIRKGA